MIENDKTPKTIGTVVEAFPNALFNVSIEGNKEPTLSYLSGKMRLNRIKILIGDQVEIIIDPYGGKARIVRRIDSRRAPSNNP